jgi:hypothetical protein
MRRVGETRRFLRSERVTRAPLGLLSVALLTGSLASCASVKPLNPGQAISQTLRADAIRRASVWTPTDIPSVDLKKGPIVEAGFDHDEWIDCDYREKEMSGASAKFTCVVRPDREVRVKYGASNPDVFGEVLSGRLFWAIGFAADTTSPVRVRCHGCSGDPMHYPKPTQGAQEFSLAAIKQRMPGRAMETHEDSGWDWSELDDIGPDAPKDARTHRDALKLLAAFIQHGDSRAANQRLLCPAGQEAGPLGCKLPLMMVQDLGLTFGDATRLHKKVNAVGLEKWAAIPVWKDQGKCVAALKNSYRGRFHNPTISEAGRAFLAGLLNQLSDPQLRALFETARVQERVAEPSNAAKKGRLAPGIEEWVRVFKMKRDQIAVARCPA